MATYVLGTSELPWTSPVAALREASLDPLEDDEIDHRLWPNLNCSCRSRGEGNSDKMHS
jgi:hypothetical protein